MENASKALLIAAAVLVVIILVAVGMKIYSSTTGTGKVATSTGDTIKEKTGDATDLAVSEITGEKASNIIDYGGKTKETLTPGDDIVIGKTEKFKVFSVSNKGIKAMPYYNLVTNMQGEDVKQGPKVSGISINLVSTFSKTWYWITGEDAIDMSNSNNKIQKYITDYKSTLQDMGINGIEVRALRQSDLNDADGSMLNPGKNGSFWMGSGVSRYSEYVWYVNSTGNCIKARYDISFGVRPIIIIPK